MPEPNWVNRTLWTGDNLEVMRGMNDDCVDLIYLDPPFNSDRDYEAPIGGIAEGAGFKDRWSMSDAKEVWHGEIAEAMPPLYRAIDAAGLTHGRKMKGYLIWMAVRLIEMRRILKPTGSIYLHCDPTASHYLKVTMDSIFGKENFHNEIAWHYYNKYARGTRVFGRNYDQILFYAFGNYTFHPQREERDKPVKQLVRENVDGVLKNKRDAEGNLMYRTSTDRKVDAVWRIPCVQPAAKQWLGYPTQKPLKLLERIILSSSNEGDTVLDPFCGCATALVSAERLERQWTGIDLSELAAKLVHSRLKGELGMYGNLVVHREDIPRRTDLGDIPRYNDPDNKHFLFGKQEGLCNGCIILFPFRNMTIDHIIPRSKGGTDHVENLQLLCGACNSKKGENSMEHLLVVLREEGIRS